MTAVLILGAAGFAMPAAASLPPDAPGRSVGRSDAAGVSAAAARAARIQAAVDQSVGQAANAGIDQAVAVVDRTSGARVASRNGTQQFISESISKLFTVAYYRSQAGGDPDPGLAAQLDTMIVHSDDTIESTLWRDDIVPSMAQRYGLPDTSNGPKTGPHDWGWELITADDETDFLYRVSRDSLVGPSLLSSMSRTAAVGTDGFDQSFGINALSGDHGSKQGWTDVGSTRQVQIHSVGWIGGDFMAILQTSDSAGYDAMRASSTDTATALQAAILAPPVAAPPSPSPAAAAPAAAAAAMGWAAHYRAALSAALTLVSAVRGYLEKIVGRP